LRQHWTDPYDYPDWVDSLEPASRRVLQLESDNILEYPIGTRLAAAKDEKLVTHLQGVSTPCADRLVSAVGFSSHQYIGPTVKAAVNSLASVFSESPSSVLDTSTRFPFIPCLHLDRVVLGEIFHTVNQEYPYWRSMDASAFDACVTSPACKFELEFSQSCGVDMAFSAAMSEQPLAFLRTRHHVSFRRRRAARNSGDSNTSSGNTLLSGTHTAYIYRGCDVKIFAFSDDIAIASRVPFSNLLLHDGSYATPDRVVHEHSLYGFEMRVQDSDIYGIQFLSARPVPAVVDESETFVLEPQIGKCLPKLFYSSSWLAHAYPSAFLHSLADSAGYAFSATPLVSEFLEPIAVGQKLDREESWSELPYLIRNSRFGNHNIIPSFASEEALFSRYSIDGFYGLAAALEPDECFSQSRHLPEVVRSKDDF